MKELNLKLNSTQLVALFEMCEFCTSHVHKHHEALGDNQSVPRSFALIMSIQSKLDGCEDISDESPSLLDQAEVEHNNKSVLMPEFKF